METININYLENRVYIQIKIPNQKYVFLKYGTASEPLSDYLPIKVLPLDQDGYGKFELPCENMIPEAATHIWVSSEDAEHNIAFAPIPNKQELPTENPNFVFYAISDIHTICKGGKQLRFQAEAFQHISDADAAFVLIAGDLSNGVQAAECSIMSQHIENRLAGIPVLQTFGNHDFHPNQSEDIPDHQSRIDFRNWLIERNRSFGVSCDYYNEYNYSTTIGGIHIVSLQGVDYSLGYIPAAALVHIIHMVAHNDNISMIDAVNDMKRSIKSQFAADKHLHEFITLVERAIELSQRNDIEDLDAICELGQGWVAEETLAIAIYCSLKYCVNFEKALIASVNHSGDSDSTGAVTGNIVGAYLGLKGIPQKYLDNLELKDVILDIADDLYNDCKITEYGSYRDEVWEQKYIYMSYSPDKQI